MDKSRAGEEEKKPQVEENKDAKAKGRKRVGPKREKREALVIKIEQSKYSDVLKAMRSDAKLVELGADVRSTRTSEMILELKRDKESNGAAYKSLAEEVLDDGVEVRTPTQVVTLKVLGAGGRRSR